MTPLQCYHRSIAETLRSDIPVALKVALDGLLTSKYNTRDTSIDDVNKYEKVELSVLLCDDGFIQKLNKHWRDVDQTTDVLSMSQHIPELGHPILLLGDIVISLETASRQAQERGYTPLDEIRVLMVHGLLHLLGFDHEISHEAEAEMEKEEELILRNLGWKGKGLIKSTNNSRTAESHSTSSPNELVKNVKMEGHSGLYEAKLSYMFCDVDDTLFNGKSQINTRMAEAMREALSRGAKVVIVTRMTRSAVIRASSLANLAGKDGIVSEASPGIFLQGSIVYGRRGQEIYRASVDKNICREAFLYSLEHEVPLVAFCEDQCFTLFEHPLIDLLHTVHHEPKAEIMPSVEHLLAVSDVQKLLFLGTAEVISTLKPYWLEATQGIADIVQATPDMLEIVPCGASKGSGIKLLLDHLGIAADEIMPHFEGEGESE
ncbi:endoribonuclease YBEY, chloroplastic isoform X3 [Musa acuminata AAA Group]|uniref:endoribonuclease YBEY, chloroplastic isoform X3 n=1 Tax=Musa acuminata AAA Group TaxID=214697 RepID=UPI0031DE13B4